MLIETPVSPRIAEGRLLRDHTERSGIGLQDYLDAGGYASLSRLRTEGGAEAALDLLEAAALRGRAGGGFPTAMKWRQVASGDGRKHFICNAHSGQPGGHKESVIIRANPHRVIEASVHAAAVIGAQTAIIYLGRALEHEHALLEQASEEARARGVLGRETGVPDVRIVRSPGGYITGEETALLEVIEGRPGRPRRKPPMPTRAGLYGEPTAIDNLETVLQAFYACRHGAQHFREAGTTYCTGTLIFSVVGEVEHPGLYELPLGTSLRTLIQAAGGVAGARPLKAALVGGVSGTVLGPAHLDTSLDYDSIRERGGDLSGGVVMVVSEATSMVDLARELADFYQENSCGKCQPCRDGTWRVNYMLNNLDRLDEKSIDWARVRRPSTKREIAVTLLNEQAEERVGISYTDNGIGLDKIRLLAKWYEHRGDCHFSTEAARAVLSLINSFAEEFEVAPVAS
jgi:NADH-quinone oxidoreductase subunit F